MMDFLALVKSRVSIRSFSKKEIEKKKLSSILEAAECAPTARNRRPLFFVILSDQKKKEELFSRVAVKDCFYDAPAILFTFSRTDDHLKELDCGAAIENALLEARSLDVGSCWIHMARERLNTEEGRKALKEILDLDKEYEVMEMIALGYPKDGTFPEKERSDNGSKIV